MPSQRNNNKQPISNSKLTASIKLARTTKKLTTTIDLINTYISIISSRSRKQNQIRTDLKRYITNLAECGRCLSTQVIPSLTIGNMRYALSRFTNIEQHTRPLHSVPTLRALTSPSKRPRLSSRSI